MQNQIGLAKPVLLGLPLAILALLPWHPGRVLSAEDLDRGVVAMALPEGRVYVGWRLLPTDPPDVSFNVLVSKGPNAPLTRVNSAPVTGGCNFVDASPPDGQPHYAVEALSARSAVGAPKPVRVTPNKGGFVSIELQGDYQAQKVGLGDFDGDGRLDYLVKQPNFNTDPYQRPGYWKRSIDTYKLEAYRHDGAFMWRYDMGWAIEAGIWYSPIVVYDLDGDGRAEVYTKAGEGDPREPEGHVRKGPEYLVKIDGLTGEVVKKVPWPSRTGLDKYNYWSRNLLGIAYLDGRRPHLIVERGTYRLIKVRAYDPGLNLVWKWEAAGSDSAYRGQGMHGLHTADVDDDGRDEIILGAAALDDDGRPLWTTGLGHPDVCYVGDIDPSRPGLEVFYGIEPRRTENGVCLVDARTGEILWGYDGPTRHVHGQGMIGDIDPAHPGIECYAGEKDGSNYWLYSATGERLSTKSLGELSPRAAYWMETPTKVYITRGKIFGRSGREIGTVAGRVVAIADCLGDWREELITSLPGEIRIYTSTRPTDRRRVCLMNDRLYRTDVAAATMGYFYPPQLGGSPLP